MAFPAAFALRFVLVAATALLARSQATCGAATYSATGLAPCTSCPVGITTTAGATGRTSVSFCTACAPGYAGTVTNPGTTSAAGCASCAAGQFSATFGDSSCMSCAANTYSYGGTTACSTCPVGASFISASSGRTPSATLTAGSTSGLAFYLSGAQSEGVSAFSTVVNASGGLTFTSGVFGAAGGALSLSSGSYLSAVGSSAPAALPTGNTAWSASAWVQCAPPATYASVLEWGAAGDAQLLGSPQAAALVVTGDALAPYSGAVTTFAGSGNNGLLDGPGWSAQFGSMNGIAINQATSVIVVADCGNQRIRLVSPAGVVSTLAGNGNAGFADGAATAASFNCPQGDAVVPSSGAIVVADQNNNRVRLVTPAGFVSTLAGTGNAAYADGAGNVACFNNPCGIAVVPSSGNVVVSECGYYAWRIRLVTPTGFVATLAGNGGYGNSDGMGASASFYNPVGLAVMPFSGVVVVVDQGNGRIRLITPAGLVTTLAGGGPCCLSDGTGTAAAFSSPSGVAVIPSSGVILVADTYKPAHPPRDARGPRHNFGRGQRRANHVGRHGRRRELLQPC